MNILLFIISLLILPPMLATTFGILQTYFISSNLRLKILLITFIPPMLYTIILFPIFPFLSGGLGWYFCLYIAIMVKEIILSNQKYLCSVKICGSYILIEYTNVRFQRRTLNISSDKKYNLRLSGSKSLAAYPFILNFEEENDEQRFAILTREIWSAADYTLSQANINVNTARAM